MNNHTINLASIDECMSEAFSELSAELEGNNDGSIEDAAATIHAIAKRLGVDGYYTHDVCFHRLVRLIKH